MNICEVAVCDGEAAGPRNMCHAHYRRWRLGKPLNVVVTRSVPSGGQCAVSDCDRDAAKNGLCNTHYIRRWRGESEWDRPIHDYVVTDNMEERLRHYCPEGDPNECWEWPDTLATTKGYGMVAIEGSKLRGAHIVAWEIANGRSLPEGDIIRHSCDNPPCTNPAHLLLGTHADNAQDRVDRGRSAKPPSGFRHKSPAEIEEIKRLHARGFNHSEIGRLFDCTRQTVAKVVSGQSYVKSGHRASSVAKLSDDAVREIRQLYATGDHSQKALADKFGVRQPQVSRIILRKGYRHVID